MWYRIPSPARAHWSHCRGEKHSARPLKWEPRDFPPNTKHLLTRRRKGTIIALLQSHTVIPIHRFLQGYRNRFTRVSLPTYASNTPGFNHPCSPSTWSTPVVIRGLQLQAQLPIPPESGHARSIFYAAQARIETMRKLILFIRREWDIGGVRHG